MYVCVNFLQTALLKSIQRPVLTLFKTEQSLQDFILRYYAEKLLRCVVYFLTASSLYERKKNTASLVILLLNKQAGLVSFLFGQVLWSWFCVILT